MRTYYEVAGDGSPLLLIAGNGMDHTAFRDQVPSFATDFRCITYDLRGIGQSDVPDDGYTVPDMARDALGLLGALGFPSAHVAGYSPRIAERHLGVLLENVGRFVRGEPLMNVADKERWY